MGRFLDKTGVTFLWQSLKSYINKVMPQKVSELQNDSGYITGVSKITFTGSQSAVYDGKSNITVNLSEGGGISDYTDLTGKPKINNVVLTGNKSASELGINIPTKTSDLINNSDFITSASVSTSLNTKADKASLARVAITGNYNDLILKPSIPVVPANVSSFINDAGYITQLNIDNALADKVDTSALKTVAFSGSYNDLTNKPNIPDGIEIDPSLSATSIHAVSNSAITAALNTKQNTLTSGTNIKTISIGGTEYSLLGSGTIPISTSSGGDPVVYTLDDIADGSTRKLSDYLKPSDLVYDDENGDYNYINEDDTYIECITALDRAIGNAMLLSGNQSVYGIKTFLNSTINFQPGTGTISFTTADSSSVFKHATASNWDWIRNSSGSLQDAFDNISGNSIHYAVTSGGSPTHISNGDTLNETLEKLDAAITSSGGIDDSTLVHKLGNETITGNKRFVGDIGLGSSGSCAIGKDGSSGNINIMPEDDVYIDGNVEVDGSVTTATLTYAMGFADKTSAKRSSDALWSTDGNSRTLDTIIRTFTVNGSKLQYKGNNADYSDISKTPEIYNSVIVHQNLVYRFYKNDSGVLTYKYTSNDLTNSGGTATLVEKTIIITPTNDSYTLSMHDLSKATAPEGDYFTITSTSDSNKIYFRCDEVSHAKTIEVSIDGGETWVEKTAESGTKTYVGGVLISVTYDSDAYIAELQNNKKLLIRGDNSCYQYNFFASTGAFDVSGNIMSLCNSNPSIFNTYSSMAEKNTFNGLFKNCTYLYNAKNLILPSIVLSEGCYSSMFRNCSTLVSAPKLPATTLAKSCYAYMFKNCSALIESSELPATIMADYCYHYMFSQSGLETAPKLPATTLANACYRYMFEGTPLTSTPDLPAISMKDSCYMGMFSSCEQLVNVPKSLPGNAPDCYREMFMGCILLETAPELPSDVANENCYNSMFKGCRKLTTAPDLPAIYLRSYSIVGGCYASMFEGCDILTEVPELPATEITKACYMNMFKGCYNLVNGPSILPAVNLNESYSNGGGEAYSCYAGMFKNCTRLEKAPVLPATTLVQSCYEEMFYGCLALDYIECLATDISANDCTYNWVNSVNMNQTGTFVKGNTNVWDVWDIDDEEDVNYGNSNGIPTGWDTEISQSARYLTFDILTNGNIDWNCYNNNKTIQYIKNDGTTWSSLQPNSTIAVSAGDKVLFKGELYGNSFDEEDTYCAFGTSNGATFNVSGNIMSLRFGDNFQGQIDISTQFSYKYMFAQLFEECGVKDASNLCLPAMSLSEGCYMGMFLGSSITKAPKLPATKLADYCYMDMFRNCSSLTEVPSKLPATSLEVRCYSGMFTGTAITTAPALPATKLSEGCYVWMFSSCTQLTASPNLNAPTLVKECYKEMFKNCSSLEEITCAAYFISALDCTTGWVQGVAASGTFNTIEGTNWIEGNNGIPSGWSRNDTDAAAHAKVNSIPFYDDETGITTYPIVRYDQGSSRYYKKFLTFEILSAGIINWKSDDDNSTKTIFYSKDEGEYWEMITSSASGTPIEVEEGDILIFKGSNASYEYNHFETNIRFNIYGNITSLIYGDDEGEIGEIKNYYTTTSVFKELFLNCIRLESAYDLILYPLNLTDSCYAYMFKGCLNLRKAPQLLATTLAEGCYQGMFEDCINLEAISALPASTLQEDCYNKMFYGCANLSSIKCLATTFATNATANWVQGVADNGTFIKDSSTTWPTGTSGIPTGWTVV